MSNHSLLHLDHQHLPTLHCATSFNDCDAMAGHNQGVVAIAFDAAYLMAGAGRMGGVGNPALVLLFALLASCKGIRVSTSETVAVVAAVLDTSEPAILPQRCPALRHRMESIVAGGDRPVEVVVTGLGDVLTADEPRTILARRYDPRATLYASTTSAGATWAATLAEECEARTTGSMRSPIYRAVARAIGSLRARCQELADAGSTCEPTLVIASDFLETEAPSLVRMIAGKTDAPIARSKLDTTGIRIIACGVADRMGGQPKTEFGRIEAAWSAVLGPILITPNCTLAGGAS